MIAEQAGSGERQSARRSHACGAPVASMAYGRDGSNRMHQPSWTNSAAAAAFHTIRATMLPRANRVARNRGWCNQSAGNTTPIRIASAVRSSGTPSNGPLR